MSDIIERIKSANQERSRSEMENKHRSEQQQSNTFNQKVIFDAFQSMVQALEGDTTKAQAIGQIFKALESHEDEFKTNKNDLHVLRSGLDTLQKQLETIPVNDLKQIPKFLQQRDTVKVSNLDELKGPMSDVLKAIKGQKLHVEAPKVEVKSPVVNVPAPVVNVEKTDLSPIKKGLEEVTKAVKNNKVPDSIKTEQTNTLICEKFDQFKLVYDDFDTDDEDPRVEAIIYYNKGKKVARINYTYDNSDNLIGGKKA